MKNQEKFNDSFKALNFLRSKNDFNEGEMLSCISDGNEIIINDEHYEKIKHYQEHVMLNFNVNLIKAEVYYKDLEECD
jgi:hypothetical protein